MNLSLFTVKAQRTAEASGTEDGLDAENPGAPQLWPDINSFMSFRLSEYSHWAYSTYCVHSHGLGIVALETLINTFSNDSAFDLG